MGFGAQPRLAEANLCFVFSRGKYCIVSVSVSLPSAPFSFKELITVKISEIYNDLRSRLGSFLSLLNHSLSSDFFSPFPLLLRSKCSLILPVFFSCFIQMQAQH